MIEKPVTDVGARASGPTRWDALAEDLSIQASSAILSERRAEATERGRAELAQVRMIDRLRAGRGREIVVASRGCGPLRGCVAAVGSDHIQLVEGSRETVVALVAVLSISGLGPEAAGSTSAVEDRLGLGSVLRRLARDRSAVRVMLDSGDVLHGTIDAVGADHLDLAEHAAGQVRRRGAVLDRRLIPIAALAALVRG